MSYIFDKKFEKSRNSSFIPSKDWLIILLLALFGSYMNYIPYSNTNSIILQTLLLGGIFLFYRKRPVLMIVAIIFLSILPARMYGGFSEGAIMGFYRLNGKICIVFSLLFLLYGLFILKRSYKTNWCTVFFVMFMIASFVWAMEMTSYTIEFWWMCTAYIVLPMFIKKDSDIRLVLTAYVLAVDMFCINVLPILVSNVGLYRGSVNLDPNYIAFYIIIAIAIVLTILTHYRGILSTKYSAFLLASIVISIITMAYFASRTSFLLLAFLITIYLMFNFKHVQTIALFLIGITALYIILNKYGIFDTVLLRFRADSATTAGGRLIIQQALLDSFFNFSVFRFFFGNGYLTANNFGVGLQAHNSYISILIGFGLVGIVTYCAYLIKIFIGLKNSGYKPFLIIFYFLCAYGFALEPYQMIEGIIFFCLLSGINNIKSFSMTK